MSISMEAAAHRLCAAADWELTQLSTQKGLYIAHMAYLGRYGEPLIDGVFEAWDYGPVLPEIYQKLKIFGRKPVRNIFHEAPAADGTKEALVIDKVAKRIKNLNPGALVQYTHSANGAWAKYYKPKVRGLIIPNEEILGEFRRRTSKEHPIHA